MKQCMYGSVTHTYILTFEKPSIAKEIRNGYTIERVEQYIPAPLQCFKCQKFGHHKKYVEDAKYVANMTQIIWKMNART